ncbi:acyl-ACP--UDP-N-acetylglucosamine O-acyltransferase [Candidatus Dependentiae bacterium]|nr:acyl-ACP--UDP-N-acetylglucosamine O-acyltransferase [Candidatus Dependentiae bacterium]MBU4386959.1 acyl-ACP--UDP-N-acetylglucosamine O-acyltransferase [Candidatus Dependentiae bacterium]MCG2756725.1 acyl-ACP--UDP-N-acetylglucosamine O-acyltransferase [Candidatus Dependentiae bacterium]
MKISKDFESNFFETQESFIHPTAIVGNNVKFGNNVKIGPNCVLVGNIFIDDGTIIYPNVTIGMPAQNLDTVKSLGSIQIGKNCRIREFASIGASKIENGQTIIGNNCYIMSYSHIAHDVILEDNVVMINNVNLGGHVHVEKNAFLMANSAAHQFCRIGQYTSLAPYSAIRQDLPPFGMFSGLPAKYFGLNLVALKRNGFSKESINNIKHVAKLFFQDKLLLENIEILAKNEPVWGLDINVQNFLNFIKNSSRGVSKKCATDIEG